MPPGEDETGDDMVTELEDKLVELEVVTQYEEVIELSELDCLSPDYLRQN